MNKLVLIFSVLISSFLSLSLRPTPRNYIESLVMLQGTDYGTLNCSEYICVAKRHPNCSAADFWNNGCEGDAVVVQHVASFDDVDNSKLHPGDVVAFHGVHVGAFVGNGVWIDSDTRHNGVGMMQPSHRRGGWFAGEVKVLRWKNPSWNSR